MKLRVENSLDDLIAFNRDFLAHSRVYRQQVRRNRLWIAVLAWVVYVLLLRVLEPGGSIGIEAAAALFGAVLMALLYPLLVRRHEKRMLTKLISEGDNDSFIGPKELEINEVGLLEKSRLRETRTAWQAVQTIRTDGSHTFIYVGPSSAFVIPHSSVTQEQLRAFLVAVQQHVGEFKTIDDSNALLS
jgi:hypothetical protein